MRQMYSQYTGTSSRSGGDARRGRLDIELAGLSEDGVCVLSVLDKVDLEALACLPAAARRVHSGISEAAINEGGEHLRRGRRDILI